VPYVGTIYPYTYDVFDAAGAPTSVATISLTVTFPDLTIQTITPTASGTGHYVYSLPLTQEGQYRLETITTGPVTADGETINARKNNSILSLRQAKDHLNIAQNNTLQDNEVREMSEAATALIESLVGPCVPRTVTERIRVTRNYGLIALSRIPVISVTSITNVVLQTTWLPADVDLDKSVGVIRTYYAGAQIANGAYFQRGQYTVTYVAGRSVIPATFVQATKEMLWHLWTSQRGMTGDTLDPDLTDSAQFENSANGAGLGFTPAIPARVRELLKPSRIPGFA
jgi:hypothetical protein